MSKKKHKPFPNYHAPAEKPTTIAKAKPETGPEPEPIQDKTIEVLMCDLHGRQIPVDHLTVNFGIDNCYNRTFCPKCFIDLLESNNVRQLKIVTINSAIG